MEGKHDSVATVKTFLCYHADINSETGWPATVRAKNVPAHESGRRSCPRRPAFGAMT